jgi:hypothetical protein
MNDNKPLQITPFLRGVLIKIAKRSLNSLNEEGRCPVKAFGQDLIPKKFLYNSVKLLPGLRPKPFLAHISS